MRCILIIAGIYAVAIGQANAQVSSPYANGVAGVKSTGSSPTSLAIQTLTDASTIQWDAKSSPNAALLLTANLHTLGNPTNVTAGQTYTLNLNPGIFSLFGWGDAYNFGAAGLPNLTASYNNTITCFASASWTNQPAYGALWCHADVGFIPAPPTTPVATWLASSGSLPAWLSFSRASSGTFVNVSGLLETAATDVARFDYSTGAVGLLLEQGVANNVLNSNWVTTGSPTIPTITNSAATGPDGSTTTNVYKVVLPAVAGAGNWAYAYPGAVGGTAVKYADGVWLKGDVGGESIYLCNSTNGANYTCRPLVMTTSWQRFSVSNTKTATFWYVQVGVDLRDTNQTAKGAQTIYLADGQDEVGSFPTSTIVTAGAQVFRASDALTAINYLTNPATITYTDESHLATGCKVIPALSQISSETSEWINSVTVWPYGSFPSCWLNGQQFINVPGNIVAPANNQYYTVNTVSNFGGTPGVDYQQIAWYTGNLPNNSGFKWTWPTAFAPGNVYTYPHVGFGQYLPIYGLQSAKPVPCKQLGTINTLYGFNDATVTGDLDNFDVNYDWFLFPTPNSNTMDYEIMIFIHTPFFLRNNSLATQVGTFIDSTGKSWIVSRFNAGARDTYQFTPSDFADILVNYTAPIKEMHDYLIKNFAVPATEYFCGMGMGVEAQANSGTFNVNRWTMVYQ